MASLIPGAGGFSSWGMPLPGLLAGGTDFSDPSSLFPLAEAGLTGLASPNLSTNFTPQIPGYSNALAASLFAQSAFSGALGANPLTGFGGLSQFGAMGLGGMSPLLGTNGLNSMNPMGKDSSGLDSLGEDDDSDEG